MYGQRGFSPSKRSTRSRAGTRGTDMALIVSNIHLCPTCNATTVWSLVATNPSKTFCCKCGEIEELDDKVLLD